MQNTAQEVDKSESSIILIAGAAGLIGSHLCEALVETGSKVIGLDDLITGSEENLKGLRGSDLFDFIEADISDELPEALHEQNLSHVVHAAHAISHLGHQGLELSQLLANSHGLKNLLDLAQDKNARALYISSLDIYRGLASHRNLGHYYDGLEVSAYYSLIEAKRYGEALAKEYWDSFGLDVRVARLGQVYGPRMDLDEASTLARLLRLALDEKDLIINEAGSREHALIYVSDAVYGLAKLLFSDREEARGGIFYLVNPERVSTLSLAYTLRELVDPKLKVEFIPQQAAFELPDPPEVDITRSEQTLFWQPRVDLSEGLEKTLRWFAERGKEGQEGLEEQEKDVELTSEVINSTADEPIPKKLAYPGPSAPSSPSKSQGWAAAAEQARRHAPAIIKGIRSRKPSFGYGRKTVVTVGVILTLLLMPWLATGAWAKLALNDLKVQNFAGAKGNFLRAEQTWRFARPLHLVVGQDEKHTAVSKSLLAAYFGADAVSQLSEGASNLIPLFTKLWESRENAPADTPSVPQETVPVEHLEENLQKLSTRLPQATASLQLMSSQLGQVEIEQLPSWFGVRSKVLELKSSSENLDVALQSSDKLIEALPNLLGYNQPHQYLVLLQNNTELRPTGGFIGSYVVFQLEDGQFTRFKVDDIYNPDGLLKDLPEVARTPAPSPIQDHLQIYDLGARDANWWPHFPRSAAEISRLYEQATGETIDTVVAVNLSLLENLLTITGPVDVDEYQEEIRADNVFERAEFHAEVGFEPGSPQKKNFLVALTEALMKKLNQGLSSEQQLSLVTALAQNLAGNEIMLYSPDQAAQNLWQQSGWAGELLEAPGDYLYVVDANVGGNKANFWVTRGTEYFVDVDRDGNLVGNLEITWNHASTSTTWPSGDYLNYLRVYTPDGVEVLESSGFENDELKFQISNSKLQMEGLVKVPIDSTKSVSLRYKLPARLSLSQIDQYSLLVQKQSGVQDEVFKFRLNLPAFLNSSAETQREFKLDRNQSLTIPVSGSEAIEKDSD